jgi:hypothetical protein
MPGAGIPEKYQTALDDLRAAMPGLQAEPNRTQFEVYLQRIRCARNSQTRLKVYQEKPPGFATWLATLYPSANAVNLATGISQGTFKKMLIAEDRLTPAEAVDGSQGWTGSVRHVFDGFFRHTDALCERYTRDRLPTDRNWLLVACPHIPTISKLWTERALAVAEVEGCKALTIVGDPFNADALSKFAEKEGGHALRFQKELDATEEFCCRLVEIFDPVIIMGGNHGDRPIHALRSHIDAPWMFEKFFKGVKWFDGEEMWLGNICLAHTRGRKVLSSASNEHSLVEEKDYLIGGPHRYFQGFSQSGRRIGYLGGLFDRDKMRYYNKQASYVKWNNGFWVYKQGGVLLGFGEERGKGFVDWQGRYGCK